MAAFFKARFALIFASALLVVMERCADAQLGKICLIVQRLSLLSSGMAQWRTHTYSTISKGLALPPARQYLLEDPECWYKIVRSQ